MLRVRQSKARPLRAAPPRRGLVEPYPGADFELICGGLGVIALGVLVVLYRSAGPLFGAAGFVVLGLVILAGLGMGMVGRRIFLSQFSFFTVLSAAGQLYAWLSFGEMQTTTDAVDVFYRLVSEGIQFTRLAHIEDVNAPLPVFVWQFFYEVSLRLGFGNGPWIGLMFNSFLVALSLAVLMLPLRILYPDRMEFQWRLVKALRFSGVFAIAGATHLRDSWVILYASALLVCLALLWRGRSRDIVVASVVFAAILLTSVYVRNATDAAYAVIVMITIGALMYSRHRRSPFLGALFVFCIALAGWALVQRGFGVATHYYVGIRESNVSDTDMARSLGTRFLLQSPFPVRAVLGSIFLYFFPIPIWSMIALDQQEYFWFKFVAAIASLVFAPRLLKLIEDFVHIFRSRTLRSLAEEFHFVLLVIGVVGFVSVALTSMESRHSMQFYPYFFVAVAISPPTPTTGARILELRRFVVVGYIVVHVIYFGLKLAI